MVDGKAFLDYLQASLRSLIPLIVPIDEITPVLPFLNIWSAR